MGGKRGGGEGVEENVNEVRQVKVRVQGSALMGSRAKREIDESSYFSKKPSEIQRKTPVLQELAISSSQIKSSPLQGHLHPCLHAARESDSFNNCNGYKI